MYRIYHSFMNVHLIIILWMFTHERGTLFHGEGGDLTCSVLFALMDLFKMFMYIYFHDLLDLLNKQGGRVL